MGWTFTADVEVYAARVWDLLAARPAENTAALTVIEDLRAGRRWSDEPLLLGWYEPPADSPTAGVPSGAVSMTPPHNLLLAAVPSEAVAELLAALTASGAEVPGMVGDAAAVEAVTLAWVRLTNAAVARTMHTRLYRLKALHPPDPPPAGRARLARTDDVDVAVRMLTEFNVEAGFHGAAKGSVVLDRIANDLLWLWEDAAGAVVSLASRNRTAASVARVGPVYTPPEQRRHGYGTALTAACTDDALQRGADEVVLFTDLSNPTSNAIYQRIGFAPVRDNRLVEFTSR